MSNFKYLNFYQIKTLLDKVAELPGERESERINLLVNHCLKDRRFSTVPDDPFSPEFTEHVHSCWKILTGRASYDAAQFEVTPINVEQAANKPDAYSSNGDHLGRFLEAYGQIIQLMKVVPGTRVLEFGAGDGQIALHLARMGCEVIVVDIEQGFLRVIEEQARRLGVEIQTVHGDFLNFGELPKVDRILFFESFHHSLQHQDVVVKLHHVLKDDGALVFAGEPIIAPDGTWQDAVPYPWGVRLDGLSLRAMNMHGWMELGFQESYFVHALMRADWSVQKIVSKTNGLATSHIARKLRGTLWLADPYLIQTTGFDAGWHAPEEWGRWTKPTAFFPLPHIALDLVFELWNPLDEAICVTIESGERRAAVTVMPGKRKRLRLERASKMVKLATDHEIHLENYIGDDEEDDNRVVGIFVERIRIAAT